jgi:hypothetical protein
MVTITENHMIQCDFCYEWLDEDTAVTDTVIDENVGNLTHVFFCSPECLKRFKKEVNEFFERN